MAEQRFIYDAHGTVVREIVYDPFDASKFVMNTRVDNEAQFEFNKFVGENIDPKASMRPIAHFDENICEKALREGWYHDKARWRAMVNDSDYANCRIWKGVR